MRKGYMIGYETTSGWDYEEDTGSLVERGYIGPISDDNDVPFSKHPFPNDPPTPVWLDGRAGKSSVAQILDVMRGWKVSIPDDSYDEGMAIKQRGPSPGAFEGPYEDAYAVVLVGDWSDDELEYIVNTVSSPRRRRR